MASDKQASESVIGNSEFRNLSLAGVRGLSFPTVGNWLRPCRTAIKILS
ncbi:MAG: hypothetical protein P4N24_03585 [Acidobacteriota bacterium]|nr:hypothetical protein [Acidobacteriota bacterium]